MWKLETLKKREKMDRSIKLYDAQHIIEGLLSLSISHTVPLENFHTSIYRFKYAVFHSVG